MKAYHPLEENLKLKLELGYRLEGKRGYYLHINVVERKDGWEKYQLFGSLDGKTKTGKILVLPLNRRSAKKAEAYWDKFDSDYFAKEWLAGNYDEMVNYAKGLTESN